MGTRVTRPRGPTAAALVVLSLAALGCEGRSEERRAVESDSAGITIVVNTGNDTYLDWRFERITSVGGDEDGPASFFRIPQDGLAFGADGEIVVLDAGNHQVKVFDPAGRHIRSIGREGRGPGEFQFPASLLVGAGGTLSVLDAGRRVVATFDRDGALAGERGAPRGFLGGAVRADGDALLYGYRVLDPEAGRYSHHLVRATEGDTTDIERVPLPDTRSVTYEACGIMLSVPPLFAEAPSWDAVDGTLVLALPPDYEIRTYEGDGPRRMVRRAIAPVAATIDLARVQLGEGEKWVIGGGRECTVPPDEVIEKRGIATHVPLIEALRYAPDGELWVRRYAPGPDSGPVDVFDSRGHYRGSLPPATPWPVVFGQDGRLLALEEDELGVQRVVLYRLVKSS